MFNFFPGARQSEKATAGASDEEICHSQSKLISAFIAVRDDRTRAKRQN